MRILAVVILCAVAGAAVGQRQFSDPCKSKTRTTSHEDQCDLYYECYDDQAVVQSCPNGLVYLGKRTRGLFGVCDYDFNVDCSDRPARNPPISTEHCDWLYGIFGHETSCTRYWTCWNGTATEQFCIGGLLYNEETHACDWPQNVGGCQKHPLCKDDPNANVPLGKSCERYWACQGGYPRLQRCPATLVFDKQSRRCVSPPTVDCDVLSTTPPPLNEGNDRVRQGSRPPHRRPPSRRPSPVQDAQPLESDAPFVSDNALPQRPLLPSPSQPSSPFSDARPSFSNARPSFSDARPSFSDARPLPALPQGSNFRPAPIPGAIPLN
ncbi:protein obstructor-E-like isoform X2 [Homarus americanus]|uniref:protein obstructor-E-like isoform X2 n=1 Tax=Homarus americanus TaxID=6706 RepID=UPI001C43FDE0|nr:protein obstructor-E-like isoform X2 [Homarus americanus]